MTTLGSRRGGVLLGLLISALVLVCLTIAAGFWFAQNVSVKTAEDRNGGNVSIKTPVGDLSVRAHGDGVDPESFGVPVYPGATRNQRSHNTGGAVLEWSSPDGSDDKSFSVSAAELITPDAPDKVMAFYRERLPGWVVEKHNGRIGLELRDGRDKLRIGIVAKSDGTHIGIASVGESPAN